MNVHQIDPLFLESTTLILLLTQNFKNYITRILHFCSSSSNLGRQTLTRRILRI